MTKQYESLYQRPETQDRTKIFAHFKLPLVPWVPGGEDGPKNERWLPFHPLADLAQGERWQSDATVDGVRKYPEGNLEILASHLHFTFLRLQEEGKILVSRDESRACFNTGLLDRRDGCDIYAFFTRNRTGGDHPDWDFAQCRTKPDAVARHWMEGFPGFPEVAEYYDAESCRDLFFHLDCPTIVVEGHIVEDHLGRFPPPFRDDLNLATVAVQRAVGRLYAQLKRNYKLAVPIWHEGRIQLLLPLCLTDSNKADLALVVERVDDRKCYVAKTILTLDMAYQGARLICRPDSEWLKGY
jgi:hypothetical protein